MHIYLCENSLEGVWSAVFQAYQDGHPHAGNRIQCSKQMNYELFAQYHTVDPNPEHAMRVRKRLLHTFGTYVYHDLCAALYCEELPNAQAADAVYHTIVSGLVSPHPRQILEHLTDSYVQTVFRAAKRTRREANHTLEFCRFRELSGGILLSVVHPRNYVLPFLISHFDNRMPLESYILYDANRDIAALHAPSKESLLLTHPQFTRDAQPRYSEAETQYEALWIAFFESIEVTERHNPQLQRQNIPMRYWKDTIELSSD